MLFAGSALAGPYGDLYARLGKQKTNSERWVVLEDATIADERLTEDRELARLTAAADPNSSRTIRRAIDYVHLKAIAEAGVETADQAERIKDIKASPRYRDEGPTERANWLSGAIERLRNLRKEGGEQEAVGAGLPAGTGLSAAIVWFVWVLLGGGIVAFIVYALRFISFTRRGRRKARAVLEADEPVRSLDEWLALADHYERQGMTREAVRALYLACLLKFDERNVARFMRGQTNWEHLARIESSPRKPAHLDFRPPTQSFDSIWYGHKVRGSEDAEAFRTWYRQISKALTEAVA